VGFDDEERREKRKRKGDGCIPGAVENFDIEKKGEKGGEFCHAEAKGRCSWSYQKEVVADILSEG